MPCYDPRDDEIEDELRKLSVDLRRRLNAATRAACEMAKEIRKTQSSYGHDIWSQLTLSTQKWIREHEKLDKARK